jgi:hypothetical protein
VSNVTPLSPKQLYDRKRYQEQGELYRERSTRRQREHYSDFREKKLAYERARYHANREAERARAKAYHARPHAKRLSFIKGIRRRFGLTFDRFSEMLIAQCGRCAMCDHQFRKGNDPAVDHDHETKAIRALLCVPCNAALGHIENIELVRMASAYLARHRC